MSSFDPTNWYWYVGGDTTRAYSSAIGDFVTSSDPTFVAWRAKGNAPTKIDTAANLGVVVANAGATRPVDAGVLSGYQNQLASGIALAIGKVLFNHENRIRTLAGQGQITAQQFITAIAALL